MNTVKKNIISIAAAFMVIFSVFPAFALDAAIKPGEYTAEVTLTGGSGKASVESPAKLTVDENGITATIIWSSHNYTYMLVDGVEYLPVNSGGNSTFVIPVTLDEDIPVSAETVAMSQPHMIDYVLHFDSGSIPGSGGNNITLIIIIAAAAAAAIAISAAILVKKRRSSR